MVILCYSVTTSIFPASPPPLFPFSAVETGLAEFFVNGIMCLAHPASQVVAACRTHTVHFYILFEVGSADPARIKLGKQMEEMRHVSLLVVRWMGWIISSHGVQQSPRGASKGFNVGRTAGTRLAWPGPICYFLRLCDPGGKSSARATRTTRLTIFP